MTRAMSYISSATKELSTLYSELDSSERGLGANEARRQFEKYGPNRIAAKETSWWQILLRQFTSPFVYVLIFASIFALYLGETIESAFIALFVVIGAILGFVQEYHSERAVEMLKHFLVGHARVLRDGNEMLLRTEDLVPGDVCLLEPGNSISADLRFIETDNLLVDESILTGESLPVEKKVAVLSEADLTGMHAARNIGFSGTTVLQGKGRGLVVATGQYTEIGGITKLTAEGGGVGTFEKGIAVLGGWIFRVILVTLALVLFINFLVKPEGSQKEFADILLFSIALAVSAIPETLPVVSAVSFSRGALALARRKVVAKRLSAVEDLGSIEVLCIDKTGTITENVMSVSEVSARDEKLCLLYGTLASPSGPGNSSFDKAFLGKMGRDKGLKLWRKINEIPFDPDRRRNSALVRTGNLSMLIVRGAPDTVLDLCNSLEEGEKVRALAWVAEREIQGERVVALATKVWGGGPSYTGDDESALAFVGVVSFTDPIKESALPAISDARELGVKIKILTGDGKNLAAVVARETGIIESDSEVMTGDEFEKLSEEEQARAVERVNVFARVSPAQKYRIVQLLEREYEVGFLGDGINDAPALKLASVGLAVETATDIARSASDIVLLNQSLSVIIDGIKGGREIFANMVKYLKTTLISNFGNFYAIAVAMILAPFLPMLPVQVLLLNLLTDTPMLAISFDTVDARQLKKPRSYDVREIVIMALVFGLINALFVFLYFVLFFQRGAAVLQTNLFIGSVLIEILLIFSVRTKKFFWTGIHPAGIIVALALIPALLAVVLPFTEWGGAFLKFARPLPHDMWLILGIASAYFFVIESVKIGYYRFFART